MLIELPKISSLISEKSKTNVIETSINKLINKNLKIMRIVTNPNIFFSQEFRSHGGIQILRNKFIVRRVCRTALKITHFHV